MNNIQLIRIQLIRTMPDCFHSQYIIVYKQMFA